MTTIEELKARIMGGGARAEEEAYSLLDTPDKDDCFLWYPKVQNKEEYGKEQEIDCRRE